MLLSRYVIRAALGDFRARLLRPGEPVRSADDAGSHSAWSSFNWRIGTRDREAVAAAMELCRGLPGASFRLQSGPLDDVAIEELRLRLGRAVRAGVIVFEPERALVLPAIGVHPEPIPPPLPSPPHSPAPGRPDSEDTAVHFELCLLDEFGGPLPAAAVDVLFRHSGANDVLPTDGGGVARLDKPEGSSFASARISDEAAVEALRAALAPLWNQPWRVQDRRDEVLTEEDDETSIVFFRSTPPPEVDGPASPSPLLSREYKLVTGEPHRVSVHCPVELVRLRGMYFDTDKCFLLPTALPDLTSIIDVYKRNRGATLLIVGHTDTSGDPAYNETLSLERAEALAAFLRDRVEDWLAWYDWGKPDEKRWGAHEDSLMIGSFASHGLTPGPNPVLAYQQWHNALPAGDRAPNWDALAEDGEIGPKTRTQLVADYMNHDRTSLPADVSVTTHGCGESFPLDPSLEEVDGAAADGERDPTDRRVEVFFFDGGLGVQPPPPGPISKPGSAEYPEWRARARLVLNNRVPVPDERHASLWVRMALLPTLAPSSGDVLHLKSTCGRYENEVRVGAECQPNEDSVDIEFSAVPIEYSYTLTVRPGEGEPYEVYRDRAYASLAPPPVESSNPSTLTDTSPSSYAVAEYSPDESVATA